MADQTQRAQVPADAASAADEAEQRKRLLELHALFADVLKVIGGGNAAGAIAAGAALSTFASKPLLLTCIKLGGGAFIAGVLCFALGYALQFGSLVAAWRIVGAVRRGHGPDFIDMQKTDAIRMLGLVPWIALAGALCFLLGVLCGLLVLIFA